jgi:hypothetical protein
MNAGAALVTSNQRLLAMPPQPDRIGGMRSYTFLMPGMMFTLILAKHIPDNLKRVTLKPSAENVIGISDEMYRTCMRAIAGPLRSARPKGYLRDLWNGPDPRSSTI